MGFNSKELKTKSTARKLAKPKDVIYDPMGQWKYPGQVTRVPDRNITMKGVPYPVLGVDSFGNQQMMMPGQDYRFPGDYVTEYPMMQKGGRAPIYVDSKADPRYKAYQDSLTLYKHNSVPLTWFPKSEKVSWSKDVVKEEDWEKYSDGIGDMTAFNNAYDRLTKLNKKEPPYKRHNFNVGFESMPNRPFPTWFSTYKKPVQPVEVKTAKSTATVTPKKLVKQSAKKLVVSQEQELPEPIIDYSVFPEQQPIFDYEAEQAPEVMPGKKIISYRAEPMMIKDPTTGKLIMNPNRNQQAVVRSTNTIITKQKGGATVAVNTAEGLKYLNTDSPEYRKYYSKGQLHRQVGDVYEAPSSLDEVVITGTDPRSNDPMTGQRFAMWDKLPEQYKQVINDPGVMGINARNVARQGHVSPNTYLKDVRNQLVTAAAAVAADDEYKKGGAKKKRTSKNLKTSINDLMTRNEMLYGPKGKTYFQPFAQGGVSLLPLSSLTPTQDLDKKDPAMISSVMKALMNNEEVEPIEVEKDKDGNFRVKDGHHRTIAYANLGMQNIPAKIKNIKS